MNIGKLGKKAAKHDKRTLKLADYLVTNKLPAPKSSIDWTPKITNWGMMLNDNLGDCTCAAAGHLIELWTANTSNQITPTDDQILSAYEAVGGYNPNDPNTDQGAVELDVLNYWRNTGIAGHKIGAYISLEPKNIQHVEIAIDLFGGVYLGVSLPITAQNQKIWSVVTLNGDGAAGSWGGHAIPIVAYDHHTFTCITWGATLQMTKNFYWGYCDEAYAIISTDWINNVGQAPSGFNIAALQADLTLLG